MKHQLKRIADALEKIVLVLEKDTNVKETKKSVTNYSSKCSLVKEISDDILKPEEKVVTLDKNPFTTKVSKHVWSKEEIAVIHYCAERSSPASHRTLKYLKHKLPNHLSENSIRRKLHHLGYITKKGMIYKNEKIHSGNN